MGLCASVYTCLMSRDLVSVVDENDHVLATKARDELTREDIVRVAVLWIENSRGEVLLQQRSLTKKLGPGHWGPAVAGTVESHETYFTNIVKEAEEEIGLVNFSPIEIGKRMYWEPGGPVGRMFMFYKAVLDRPAHEFTIQLDEVAQLKWVPKSTLLEDVKRNPKNYAPSSALWQDVYY